MRSKIVLLLALGWMTLLPTKGAAFGCCDPCGVWNGVYVGINGGYFCGKNSYHFPRAGGGSPTFINTTFANLFADYQSGGHFRQRSQGGVIGGHFGFNKQCACLVLGVEGAIDGTRHKKTTRNPFEVLTPVADRTYQTRTSWFATFTPRIGYACDCWLLYVKGGFAATHIKSTLNSNQVFTLESGATGSGLSFSRKHYALGWTVGAGIEYVWCRNWVVGVEYDHHKFRKPTFGGQSNPDTTWPVFYKIAPSYNMVLVRVSFKC